jgi:dTDP-glucose 4,6-dehydratase
VSRAFLVTGGAGFIGSWFIRHLLTHEPDALITNLDNLSRGTEATVHDIDDRRVRFVRGDIRDRSLVDRLMGDVDVVVNFAAESHVDRSIETPVPFVDTNVLGTTVLIEEAAKQAVGMFVQVSSDEVYGPIEEGNADENGVLRPSSPYAATKAAADLLVRSFATTYGYKGIITRCTNNYGPYQYPDKIVPLFITNLLEGKQVPLYGDGHHQRDWIHVADHCAAIHVLTLRGTPGETYNIGTGNHVSNLHLARMILKNLGLGDSRIEHVADRPGHDARYAVDATKIEALGWKADRRFAEGLEETIVWYAARRDWWRPLRHV